MVVDRLAEAVALEPGISVSVGGTTKSASLLFRLANCSLAEHKAVEQEIKSMVPSKSI